MGGPDRVRNFYVTDIPFDPYNTERIDINRVANSFLFGLGSPAGLINNTMAQARFRDSIKITTRIGSAGKDPSYRASFSLNRVVVEDKLAVRVNGLMDRTQYRQRPTYKNDDRIDLAFNYRPFGDSNTILRGSVERGTSSETRPTSCCLRKTSLVFWSCLADRSVTQASHRSSSKASTYATPISRPEAAATGLLNHAPALARSCGLLVRAGGCILNKLWLPMKSEYPAFRAHLLFSLIVLSRHFMVDISLPLVPIGHFSIGDSPMVDHGASFLLTAASENVQVSPQAAELFCSFTESRCHQLSNYTPYPVSKSTSYY